MLAEALSNDATSIARATSEHDQGLHADLVVNVVLPVAPPLQRKYAEISID